MATKDRLTYNFGRSAATQSVVDGPLATRATSGEKLQRTIEAMPAVTGKPIVSGSDGAAQSPHRPRLSALLLSGRFEARGTCSYTLRLAEHFERFGVHAYVVCTSAAGVPAAKRESLSFREIPYLETPLLRQFTVRELAAQWRAEPPDLVHVQNRKVLPAAHVLCDRLQVPFVLTVHDLQQSPRPMQVGGWCRKVIAVSDAVRENLVTNAQIPAEAVCVIRSGVELPPQEPVTHCMGIEDRVPVIGTAGPLERVKGHPYFLQAAQMVLNRGVDAEFLVAGAGPEESNLRRLTRLLGIADHVTFVPYLHEFTEVLKSMDIFCLPSLQQGLGTVMLEAMAMGKPVIASGVGGVYSVVQDGQTGLLMPRANATALAEKIIGLLHNPKSACQLGARARELVASQFGILPMVEQTARLYREVLPNTAVVGNRATARP